MSVCRTVSEIFRIKKWHDLETGVEVVQVIENGTDR